MQNICWMEHTYPKWSIFPLLPQLWTAGAVTLKHLNLHVNLLWKVDGSKPQSLQPLGMFILNLNQWIWVETVHKAPEPRVQMAVASGNGRIWQSSVCRTVCCWVWRNLSLECERHPSSTAARADTSLCCSCWCCGIPDMFSMVGLTAGAEVSHPPQVWSAGLAVNGGFHLSSATQWLGSVCTNVLGHKFW